MPIEWSESNKRSSGGTEIMMRGLEKRVDPSLLDEFQIIPSRLQVPLDPSKIRILWCHDLPEDPMYEHLKNGGWKKFHRIVFVSYHQMNSFIRMYGIPQSRCAVLHNAIVPFDYMPRPDGPIRMVYTSTPHRGLNILYAAFNELAKTEDIILDVYSSFKLYGWENGDDRFKDLFDLCEAHPKINYHGVVPNDSLRERLQESHIFAYPSTWEETSCLCLMEAMSANLLCVHSDLGALPETSALFTMMYPFHEDPSVHAGLLMGALKNAIEICRKPSDSEKSSKKYADMFFSWNLRSRQWEAFLKSLLDEDRSMEEEAFVYSF